MSVEFLDPGLQLPPQVCQALFKSRREPLVVKGQLTSWAKLGIWDHSKVCEHLGSKTTTFKVSPKRGTSTFLRQFKEKEVVFETQCDFVETTFDNFLQWLNTPVAKFSESLPPQHKRIKIEQSIDGEDTSNSDIQAPSVSENAPVSSMFEQPPVCQAENPLLKYLKTKYWVYSDYKYMSELCCDLPDMLTSVDWSVIGFEGRDGTDSTLWVGSEGANTPCHFDTYGCNFVAQLSGKKKWILFSPQDSDKLYPTRVPYEESSVLSRVNITDPDLIEHPAFSEAKPYEVVLLPGDLLYVPRHWWHYVESVGEEPTVSVNTWIELPEDAHERVKEAVVRTTVSAFLTNQDGEEASQWINPNEILFSTEENLLLLSKVLKDFNKQQGNSFGKESDSNLTTGDFLRILTTPTVVGAITEILTKHSDS